jgi:ATP-dependent RNA helicase MRH4
MGVNVKLLEGGNIGSKITSPHSGEVDLLISTVHVLSALKSVGIYTMNKVQHIVLDEADTLLDDSFSPGVVDFLNGFSVFSIIQIDICQMF